MVYISGLQRTFQAMKINLSRRALIGILFTAPVIHGLGKSGSHGPAVTDEDRIRADFIEGRITLVDGWVLSQYEVKIFSETTKK